MTPLHNDRPWYKLKARYKTLLVTPLLLAVPLGYVVMGAAIEAIGINPDLPLISQPHGMFAVSLFLGGLVLSCILCGCVVYVLLRLVLVRRGYTRQQLGQMFSHTAYPAAWLKDGEV
jgi:hypothetical protein